MQFKDVFDWNPLPTEQYGKWILRAERHGGGRCMVIALALQGTARRPVLTGNRLFQYFSPSFLKERCRSGNNKNKKTRSQKEVSGF